MNKRAIGYEKETKAANFLKESGYEILGQNFYHKGGEIDIIAKNNEYLVFLEVKYRTSKRQGTPEEAITWRKIKSIYHTAQYYMLKNGYPEETPCRFDVVVMLGDEIKIIKDAFQIGLK